MAKICLFAFFAFLLLKFCSFGVGWVKSARFSSAEPDAIVVLGGNAKSEVFAAALAQRIPDIPVIISSGHERACAYNYFVTRRSVDWDRIIFDYTATDTFTNFTSTIGRLKKLGAKKVFVITAKGHWYRAKVLAALIYRSSGIAVEPRLIEGPGHYETATKRMLDMLRAVAWLFLGDVVARVHYASDADIQKAMSQREAECQAGGFPHAVLPDSVLTPGFTPDSPETKNARLLKAILAEQVHRVEMLLIDGADPNAVDEDGRSAFALAIAADNEAIARSLLERGAKPDRANKEGLPDWSGITADSSVYRELKSTLAEKGFSLEKKVSVPSYALALSAEPRFDYKGDEGTEISIELRNTSEQILRKVSVSAQFAHGLLAEMQGSSEVAINAKAQYRVRVPQTSLYQELSAIKVTCLNCNPAEFTLASSLKK